MKFKLEGKKAAITLRHGNPLVLSFEIPKNSKVLAADIKKDSFFQFSLEVRFASPVEETVLEKVEFVLIGIEEETEMLHQLRYMNQKYGLFVFQKVVPDA